jgi:hypothetical protein
MGQDERAQLLKEVFVKAMVDLLQVVFSEG